MPKNIYGVTKAAAEDLCQLFHRNQALPCVVLRTSRFFPEEDDNRDSARGATPTPTSRPTSSCTAGSTSRTWSARTCWPPQRAPAIGFAHTSSAPPRRSRPKTWPNCAPTRRPWCAGASRSTRPNTRAAAGRCSRRIDRVYVNARARAELGWQPRYDFASIIARLQAGDDPRSALAQAIGRKGYHAEAFTDGPFPVE